MKKIFVMLLAILLLMGLCACGSSQPTGGEELQITVKPKTEGETTTAEETTTDVTTDTTAAQETTTDVTTGDTTAPATDKKELAKSCIGKNVSELYALIGKPSSSDYAPSCLVEGEDGMLYYNGFVVYTTREGDVETVYYVE